MSCLKTKDKVSLNLSWNNMEHFVDCAALSSFCWGYKYKFLFPAGLIINHLLLVEKQQGKKKKPNHKNQTNPNPSDSFNLQIAFGM